MLGWVAPDEADRVGLDPEIALNLGYACLRASKLKANKPDMIFLERVPQGEAGASCWWLHPDGARILAQLMANKRRVEELAHQDQILLLLREEAEDARILAEVFPGDSEGKKRLERAFSNLRNKFKFVQPRSRKLTLQGFERVHNSFKLGWGVKSKCQGLSWKYSRNPKTNASPANQMLPRIEQKRPREEGMRRSLLHYLPWMTEEWKAAVSSSWWPSPTCRLVFSREPLKRLIHWLYLISLRKPPHVQLQIQGKQPVPIDTRFTMGSI